MAMKPVLFGLFLLRLFSCQAADPSDVAFRRTVALMLDAYPDVEAREHTSTRTPHLAIVWEGRDRDAAIPSYLLRPLAQSGLKLIHPDSVQSLRSSVAVLSLFEPRVRGDSVFVYADWIFPLEPRSFFGQEYEAVFVCRDGACRSVRFEHVGTLN